MSESFAIAMFGALFAVMNPFINLPVFLGLTEDLHQAEQRRAATKILTYTAVSCVISAISGTAILEFIGLPVAAFRLARSLVLVQMSFTLPKRRLQHCPHGHESGRVVPPEYGPAP